MEFRRFVTTRQFRETINELRREMAHMATQSDVDAVTTQVQQVATDLQSAQSSLQAEIDQLAQANPSVDLTALQAAVAPLDSAVQALGQIKPDQPAPTPPAPAGP